MKIAIELDGLSHHFDETISRDEIKEEYLRRLNIDVLRFEDKEVMGDIDNVMAVILDAISGKTDR